MSMHYEDYMRQVIQPMREQLIQGGFRELTTPEEVESFFETVEGTTLVVINSVCGCAAGLARPAAIEALKHPARPNNTVTVFAGQDKDATATMRSYISDYEPSSPSMALFQEKKLVHFIAREEIEDHAVEDIVENLTTAFDKFCK